MFMEKSTIKQPLLWFIRGLFSFVAAMIIIQLLLQNNVNLHIYKVI